MKRIRKALTWLLCAVVFAGAVACSGGKGASGQKVTAPEVQQGKTVVNDGKDREKPVPAADSTPEEVVVENNDMFSLPKGMTDYGLAASSWGQYAVDNNLTPEQAQAGLDRLAQGDMPEGQSPATGLLTAWGAGASIVGGTVLLPATGAAAVIGGAALGGTTDAVKQITTIHYKPDERYSYTDTLIAMGTGALTQGKGLLFTEGVNVTGAWMSSYLKGENATGAVIGTAIGTVAGAKGGKKITEKLAPVIVSPVASEIGGVVGGSLIGTVIGSGIESGIKSQEGK